MESRRFSVPPVYPMQPPERETEKYWTWKHIFEVVGLAVVVFGINFAKLKAIEKEKKKRDASIDHYADESKEGEVGRELDDIEIMNKVKMNAPMGAEECGGVGDGYRWTQTEWEIDVKVDLEFAKDKLEIAYKIANGVEKVVMDGVLFAEVVVSECGWSIEGGELWVMLRKKQETNGKGHWAYVVDDG
eukprot:CAMPEP_0118666474 /NCGR_PEP_ID=MMETSP0785-20121206/19235_1 /TAXON_ID=91992 /ORGANISM="Bolidomonas pacifica, Strain CCMP 1866" /LENGTH=187 /DNA_ID=CAMNT_0006560789 /DNA_START=12 /DNA_END=571 /DNA_ORIENTATION=-